MTIRDEIKKRLGSIDEQSDYDDLKLLEAEIRVFHEGLQSEFSDRFNSEMVESWGGTLPVRLSLVRRLLAILDAEDVKSKLRPVEAGATSLLPTFSLDEDDKQRMLKIASDLRKIVTASTDFDHPHKVRLLDRVAAMESEVHKPKGLFDVFLGGVNDFGEAAGKFGKDVKPLTDRVQEMASIARKNTEAYDKLAPPDEVKELPSPDNFEDD